MDFIDQIQALAARIPKMLDRLETEEATKNALIMPFIAALGYNVFDPTEVVPEYTADVGTKKGEKVDYAILQDDEPIIIFECKSANADLDKEHASQLFRYFATLPTRIAILTNGVVYRFFSDLEEENKMDSKPFLEFNMLDIKEQQVRELKKLSKAAFDLDTMLSAANELKYSKAIRDLFVQQLEAEPEEEFIRFFVTRVYQGRMTKAVREQFGALVPKALTHYIRESVNDRLQSALNVGKEPAPPDPEAEAVPAELADPEIETTEEEKEAFLIVRAIMAAVVDPSRVIMRDTKSYCGILLDDNNRKPICRLRFNASSKKYLGVFDAEKSEERVPIEALTDIYQYADMLKAMVAVYDG